MSACLVSLVCHLIIMSQFSKNPAILVSGDILAIVFSAIAGLLSFTGCEGLFAVHQPGLCILRSKIRENPPLLGEQNVAGWWLSHPCEKYEFISWDDDSQYMESHKIHVPNHQPGRNNPRSNHQPTGFFETA